MYLSSPDTSFVVGCTYDKQIGKIMERSRLIQSAERIMPAFSLILERGVTSFEVEFDADSSPFRRARVETLPEATYGFTFELFEGTSRDVEKDVIGELFGVLRKFDWEYCSHQGLKFIVQVKKLTKE